MCQLSLLRLADNKHLLLDGTRQPRNDEDSGVLGKANNQAKSSSLRGHNIKFIAHLVKQVEAI